MQLVVASSSQRALSLGAMLMALLVIGLPSAYAVRNGIATNDLPKTVMAFINTTSTGAISGKATVTNIHKPRCMLTAAHVAENISPPNETTWIFQGQSIWEPGKWQRIQSVRMYPAFTSPMTDLAVLWLKNEDPPAGDTTHPRMKEPGDYAKIDHGGLIPNTDTGVTIMGYGTGGLTTPQTGVKRKGTSIFIGLVSGPALNPPEDGGYYVSLAGTAGHITCPGDSGGPLFKLNDYSRTYGVASTSTCSPSIGAKHTSVDSAKKPGGFSNLEWVNRNATELCGIVMSFFFPGYGYVTGTLVGATYTYSDDTLVDGDVYCDPTIDLGDPGDDCHEIVHSGEYLELTAHPDPGWHFASWQHVDEPGHILCPCVGQDETCIASYEDMGYYGPGISIDSAACEVEFLPN